MASEKYIVIGPRRIVGVAKGGTVELDPARHNVPALIEAGHVKPKTKPAAAPAVPPVEVESR